jgi:hypothetical protein
MKGQAVEALTDKGASRGLVRLWRKGEVEGKNGWWVESLSAREDEGVEWIRMDRLRVGSTASQQASLPEGPDEDGDGDA